jgi:hypothetical protein
VAPADFSRLSAITGVRARSRAKGIRRLACVPDSSQRRTIKSLKAELPAELFADLQPSFRLMKGTARSQAPELSILFLAGPHGSLNAIENIIAGIYVEKPTLVRQSLASG